MNQLPRLEIQRQVIVGHAVAGALAAERPAPLTDATRARGEAVVSATVPLETFAGFRPIQVDRATDGVILGLDRMLDHQERALRNDIVARGEAQLQTLADVQLVRNGMFPNGTDFTRISMELQWSELVMMRNRMQEPAVAAAIDRLGYRSTADHVLAHIEVYGHIIGQNPEGPSAGEQQARVAWDEAFRLFAAQVALDYENDPATQNELVGAFEAQLEQQRAAVRAVLRARRAQAKLSARVNDMTPAPSAGAPAP